MIKSMTGFGKTEYAFAGKIIAVLIRSVNSKQLDVMFHLPLVYRDYEADFRAEIVKIVQRGKVDIAVTRTMNDENISSKLNEDVVIAYLKHVNSIAAKSGFITHEPSILHAVLTFPGIFAIDDKVENEEEKKALFGCFQDALHKFNCFREKEGIALIADILKHVDNIEKLLSDVKLFEQERISQVKVRIENLFNEFIPEAEIDKNRFEQEMIYYLEKLDITEEKVRLKQHCDYFKQTINEENPGRKLGFIVQEMGREINTLGSKAGEVNIQRVVVEMKDELEKIKEQIFNVL